MANNITGGNGVARMIRVITYPNIEEVGKAAHIRIESYHFHDQYIFHRLNMGSDRTSFFRSLYWKTWYSIYVEFWNLKYVLLLKLGIPSQ